MLQEFADYLTYSVLQLEAGSTLGDTVNYFIYDSVKIILLLFFMIMAIGFIRSYLPPNRIRKLLSHTRFGIGHFLAAVFGAVTPFCSCSSIPIFMSLIKVGVPLGVSFSFLTTSPIINEYLVVLMLGFFGWKITAAYVISGILLGMVSGLVIGRMNLEEYLEEDIVSSKNAEKEMKFKDMKSRIKFGWDEAVSIVKKLWLWILAGVGIGAAIHGFIPEEAIHNIINTGGVLTVPIAVLVGVPLYASCAAIIPIAVALFQKGVPLGTALAFMMATSALSLPEAIMLRRVMRIHLIIIFFAIVAAAITLTGYIFNFLQNVLV